MQASLSVFWALTLIFNVSIAAVLAPDTDRNSPNLEPSSSEPSADPNDRIFTLDSALGLGLRNYAARLTETLRGSKFRLEQAHVEPLVWKPLIDAHLLVQVEAFPSARRFVHLGDSVRLANRGDNVKTRQYGWVLALPLLDVSAPPGTPTFAFLSVFSRTRNYEPRPSLLLHGYASLHGVPRIIKALAETTRDENKEIEIGDVLSTEDILKEIRRFG